MKKLHSVAFYALVTPVITLGAGSVLAQQPVDRDVDTEQHRTQQERGSAQQSTSQEINRARQSTLTAGQSDAQTAAQRQQVAGDQSRMQNKGFMRTAPANSMHINHLIGATVKTPTGEDVGPVDDLIVDEHGQIVALVVGVGGFLGMGERNVAIGWDDMTRSGTGEDNLELRVDVTRESLRSAPEYEEQD